MQISTAADPKVVARSIAIGRGRTDTEKNELIRNRKKYVYKKDKKEAQLFTDYYYSFLLFI